MVLSEAIASAQLELPKAWSLRLSITKYKVAISLRFMGREMYALDPGKQALEDCITEMVDFASDTQRQIDLKNKKASDRLLAEEMSFSRNGVKKHRRRRHLKDKKLVIKNKVKTKPKAKVVKAKAKPKAKTGAVAHKTIKSKVTTE